MKKNILILTLALMIALPVFGLAAEVVTAPAAETTVPLGQQYGPRWRQSAPATAPQTNYVDADNDGVCDVCGNVPGTNADAPGYVDADNDGVCDHFGTDLQGQAGGAQQGQGGRHLNPFGRGQAQTGNGQRGRNRR